MELCGHDVLVPVRVIFRLGGHLGFRVGLRSAEAAVVVADVGSRVGCKADEEEPAEGLVGRCRDMDGHGCTGVGGMFTERFCS